MARYLVTGAAGFIAARTAELLLDAGHGVTGCDNLNDYYDVRLKEHRLARLTARPGFTFLRADVEDPATLAPLFAGPPFAAIIHLAARAGVRASIDQPESYFATNVAGTLHLLEQARRRRVAKFVLASSSSLYAGQPLPFTEDLAVNTPGSPYAASKKSAEMLAYVYHQLHGLDCTVLRYFTVYGPAGRPDMAVLRFLKLIDEGRPLELLGDGTQARDFTYIDDIARGTIAALRPLGHEIVNLGGGQPLPLTAIIDRLSSLIGRPARFARQPEHPADLRATSADIAKAERLLGWKPVTGIDEGLRLTVEWYRANRAWLKDLKL